ncbi:MAG: HAMP domain-containing sensor histidine kinase [Flavobacteriaceae bacterium]
MTFFLVPATLVFIVLIYLSFKRWDVLYAMMVHQNTNFLQQCLNRLEDDSRSGLIIAELLEIEDQEVWEALLKEVPLATYVFSGITGHGKFVNSAFERLLGYTLNDIPSVDHYIQLIFPDKNYGRFIKNELDTICRGNKKALSPNRSIEVYVSCKDGSTKCILLGGMSKGNLMCYYAYDATKNEKKEDTILHAEYQMDTLNTDKNKIFSIIAHDLRSPFNTILGCSELLLDSIEEKDTEAHKYSKIVHATAQNSLALLDNLLNWSKLQMQQSSLNAQKIILSAVINEIIELFSSAATIKKIDIVHLGSDDIEICTDIEILKTVLRNMVSNAIKFTRVGGKVSIKAKKVQGKVEIAISDNGIGISKRNADKLFNIETNKWTFGTSNEKGSGLGLPLCKEFMEKLGGNICVKSIEGEGSEFKLILPVNYGE